MKHIEQCVRQLKAYRGFLPAFLEDELFEKAERELVEIKAIQMQAEVMPNEVVAGGRTETDIRIDENKYWLEYINRFAPHVPNHFRRANKHNFLDRIKELEENKPA